jgi:dipeptidyl aminopeptidase/acylaminoacyl peptidase
VALIFLFLLGCAEEGPGPQFASDPRPSPSPDSAVGIATPAPLPTLRPAATPLATAVAIDDLLSTRGAPPRVYVALDDGVWAIDGEGEATRVLTAPANARVAAISPAPNAERVAVLLVSEDAAFRSEVVVLDAGGAFVNRIEGFATEVATPTAGAIDDAGTIDWSPQGDKILVALHEGVVFSAEVDGEDASPELILNRAAGEVLQPSWSPTGESIAFIQTTGTERERSLQTLDVINGTESTVIPASDQRLIVEYAWMPDGRALLFAEGSQAGGAVTGIDLWRVDVTGENRELVASAGTVAPVARIANIRPSPDGRAVAYSVLVPGEHGPRPDSVWVRDLTSRVGFRLDLPAVAAVGKIDWTDKGLLFSVLGPSWRPSAPADWAVFRVGPEGGLAPVWTPPRAAATPIRGSPQAGS